MVGKVTNSGIDIEKGIDTLFRVSVRTRRVEAITTGFGTLVCTQSRVHTNRNHMEYSVFEPQNSWRTPRRELNDVPTSETRGG